MINVFLLKRNDDGLIQGKPIVKALDFEINDPLTLEQCHEIVILLCQIWQIEKPDCIGIDMENGQLATYNVNENSLRIWKDDCPIYENQNGVICVDAVTIIENMMR